MAQNYQLQKTGQEIDDLLQKIDDLGPASSESAGTMSAADKGKLDDIETGAERNVIEGIVLGETSLTPSASKTITIPVDSEPAEGSENLVASGGVYEALVGKIDKDTSAGENDIAVFNDEGQVVGAFDVNEVVREGRIKQTTGQSTTDLMSQKAVTDELDTKAAKDDDAVEGNLAKFDSNGNPVDAGIAAEKVAQKGEIQTYSGNLVDTRSAGTAQEFTYRKSGGDGVNWMRRIKGKSLVWNQLVPVTASSRSKTESGVTIVDNRDGSFTVSTDAGGATNNVYLQLTAIGVISGRKYLFKSCPKGGTDSTYYSYITGSGVITATTKEYGEGAIVTTSGTGNAFFVAIYIKSGTVLASPIKFWPILIDLTLLFGDGKEPSTVEEFEALYNELYYPYQPGVIKNNDAVEMESIGFNQWDEEWESGYYDVNTGLPVANANHIRSKADKPIPVFPSTSYYTYYGGETSSSRVLVFFYDAGMNFISRTSGETGTNVVWTTPANCAFVRFYVELNTTYQNDICINISDASRNGTYEPYWKKSIQLGLNAFRVTDGTNVITVNGLKSAGSVYDEIDTVRKKDIKRVETRAYQSGDESDASVITDMTNTNYALATPVEYDLVDDIPNAIEVDENGTERAIFPEAVDPSAPFCSDSNYSVSTANLVRKLNDAS